jgi:hypothetical protein
MRESPEQFPCEYHQKPPYEVMKTPWITTKELELLHHTEQALDRLYNRGRFRRTVSYLLSAMEVSPFTLFSEFGQFLSRTEVPHQSLDQFTAVVYDFFGSQSGVEQTALRDVMVCDRLATNASGKLPKVLQIQDPALKREIKNLEQTVKRKKEIRRGYALLYGESCLVYADYENKNPVTGEFTLNQISYEEKV